MNQLLMENVTVLMEIIELMECVECVKLINFIILWIKHVSNAHKTV